MNKNRIEGVADQGERASNREALVIKKRRRSGGRAVQLKQWKRGTTMYRELLVRGAKPDGARQVAANSRRCWRNSGMRLDTVLPLNWSGRLGLPRLS
jgi:hypothetical protein